MSWQYIDQMTPKARKEHRCTLCALPIPRGTVYVKRVGVSDGEWINMRMHPACEALTRDYDEMDWECHDEAAFRHYQLELTECTANAV